jgi:hypothetical protein
MVPLNIKDDRIMFPPQENARAEFISRVADATGVTLTPEDLKAKYICRAPDNTNGDRFGNCARCGLSEWDGNKKPVCTKNINIMCLFEGDIIPSVLQMSNTSHKHGKTFKQATVMSGKHLFAKVYTPSISKKEEGTKLWYEVALKPSGNVESQEKEVEYYRMMMQYKPMFLHQMANTIVAEPEAELHTVEEGTEY